MAVSHTIRKKDIDSIVAQAQLAVDVSKPYRLLIEIEGDVAHVMTSRTSGCTECIRYENLIASRRAVRIAEENASAI